MPGNRALHPFGRGHELGLNVKLPTLERLAAPFADVACSVQLSYGSDKSRNAGSALLAPGVFNVKSPLSRAQKGLDASE